MKINFNDLITRTKLLIEINYINSKINLTLIYYRQKLIYLNFMCEIIVNYTCNIEIIVDFN